MSLTSTEISLEKDLISGSEEVVLKSNFESCKCCKYGRLVERQKEKAPDSLVIYTRNGSFKGYHQEKRCNNQSLPCRAGHFYGYVVTPKGEKQLDEHILSNEYLVTSQQTAFSIDYLWDITLQILFSQASFESLANIYNNLFFSNCTTDTMNRREEVVRKRIAEAWFYYAYIEMGQRYGIEMKIEENLEKSILKNMVQLKDGFRLHWTQDHKCNLKGCDSVIVLDGGMKPHRSVCGDTLSGVTEFQLTGNKVVTGIHKDRFHMTVN